MELENPGTKIIRIVLIFLAIAFFVLLIIWIFRPKSPDTGPTEPTTSEPEQWTTVKYVQDGKITAPEEHNSIAITITPTTRRIEVFRGYSTGPKKSESFPNSQASYDAFYAAIKNSGFFSVRQSSTNEDGYCPLGVRYNYLAGFDISNPDKNSWGASCNSKVGTFAGNAPTIRTLFKNQIPDYNKIVQGVKSFKHN